MSHLCQEPGKVLLCASLMTCRVPAPFLPQYPIPQTRRCGDGLVSLGKPAHILSFPLRIYGQTCCNYGGWKTLDSYGQSQPLDKGSGRGFYIQHY